MDKEKLLTKTHGGALYHDNSADNKELTGKAYFFHERALENKKEKEAIAANAIHMVKDHMCIFFRCQLHCLYTWHETDRLYRTYRYHKRH